MLVYHPAYDMYHTCYRILSILDESKNECLEVERVRIYDFILLFPHELKNVKLPAGTTDIRRNFKETPYNKLPNRKKVFQQIKYYFDLSTHCLVSYGALDLDKYQNGLLCKTEKFESIAAQLGKSKSNLNREVLTYFSNVFSKLSIEDLKRRFN